jgi:tetratricopeptide (TPR) repeat protein
VLLLASMRGGQPPVKPSWKLRLEVGALAPPHAQELLLDVAGDIDPGSPLMPTVLDALGGVPLAIELFAAQAAGLGDLGFAWRQWAKRRVAMLSRGADADRLSSLAVSLSASLASPRMNDAARRLYKALGRLPDGWEFDAVDQLLPGDVDDPAQRLLRTRLVYPEAGRLRMLKPVREHALAQPLEPADERHLAELLGALADALPLQQESPPDPERAARARREIANVEAGLAGMRPSGPAERHDLGWRWMQVGDTRLARSELAAALRAYEAAEAEFRGCMALEPDHARWRRSAAIASLRIGEGRRVQGEFGAARLACGTAVSTLEALAAVEPGNPQWRRDLAVARSGQAELLVAAGDLAGGAAAHAGALEVLEALAATGPADAALERDLLVAWIKVGQLKLRQRDLAAALAAHERAAGFAAALARRDPTSPEWRRDRSVARLGTGDVLREQGDLAAALAAYEEARAIREDLAAAEPGNPRRERDLAVCWERIAMTRHRLGERAGALEAWRRALAISERLAEAHPDNVDLRLAPAIHLNGIADALDHGDVMARREAEASLRRALELLRAAADAHRLDAERQGWIPALEAKLAKLAEG